MEILLLFTLSHLVVFAEAHSLQYHYTALTPRHAGSEFTAVGLLDEKQYMSYSSSHRRLIPNDWIKNIMSENYWKDEAQNMQSNQYRFNSTFKTVREQFKHSREGHTLQRMYGCESDDNGITRRYDQYGFDGEDLISLDLETGTWIAVKPQALILERNWESNGYTTYWKNFLENKCIDLLKTFVNYGRETVERKDRPEMSLFQTEASSPEVVCHATGFYPKALMISWQKDGQDELEDVDLRETLPNQDGSFQRRSILKVSAEELQKHTYTCVIEHSSLEKDLVLPVSERRILRGGGSDEGQLVTKFIIGVVVLSLFLLLLLLDLRSGRRKHWI